MHVFGLDHHHLIDLVHRDSGCAIEPRMAGLTASTALTPVAPADGEAEAVSLDEGRPKHLCEAWWSWACNVSALSCKAWTMVVKVSTRPSKRPNIGLRFGWSPRPKCPVVMTAGLSMATGYATSQPSSQP